MPGGTTWNGVSLIITINPMKMGKIMWSYIQYHFSLSLSLYLSLNCVGVRICVIVCWQGRRNFFVKRKSVVYTARVVVVCALRGVLRKILEIGKDPTSLFFISTASSATLCSGVVLLRAKYVRKSLIIRQSDWRHRILIQVRHSHEFK